MSGFLLNLENGGNENIMYVVGATKASHLADIRQIIPDSFLLIPGIGRQGNLKKFHFLE